MRFGHQLKTAMSSKDAPERNFAAIMQENEQLRFAMTELCHRTKNLVAIIQSIARQTMRQTATDADFDVRFAGRLGALGRSLDLLIDGDWRGARLENLYASSSPHLVIWMATGLRRKDRLLGSIRRRPATLVWRCTSWRPMLLSTAHSQCQRAKSPCIGRSREAVDRDASS